MMLPRNALDTHPLEARIDLGVEWEWLHVWNTADVGARAWNQGSRSRSPDIRTQTIRNSNEMAIGTVDIPQRLQRFHTESYVLTTGNHRSARPSDLGLPASPSRPALSSSSSPAVSVASVSSS